MSSMFGGGQKQAQRQQTQQIQEARVATQDATEEELRSRQKAERGGKGRASRAVLMGNLTAKPTPAANTSAAAAAPARRTFFGTMSGAGLKRTVGG